MHADNMIYVYQTYYLMTIYKSEDNSTINLWHKALDHWTCFINLFLCSTRLLATLHLKL